MTLLRGGQDKLYKGPHCQDNMSTSTLKSCVGFDTVFGNDK